MSSNMMEGCEVGLVILTAFANTVLAGDSPIRAIPVRTERLLLVHIEMETDSVKLIIIGFACQ